jgi:hypothetical protein
MAQTNMDVQAFSRSERPSFKVPMAQEFRVGPKDIIEPEFSASFVAH